jgi:hypothetical protein
MNGHLPSVRFSKVASPGIQAYGTLPAGAAGSAFDLDAALPAVLSRRAVLISVFDATGTAVLGDGLAFRVQNGSGPPAGGVNDCFQVPLGRSVLVTTSGYDHLYSYRSSSASADVDFSVQLMDEEGQQWMDTLPPIHDSTFQAVTVAVNVALPTLPDGSNPSEVIVCALAAAVGDAVAYRFTEDAADATAVGDMAHQPCGVIRRHSSAGFSHIRLNVPATQVNNPDVTIAAVA